VFKFMLPDEIDIGVKPVLDSEQNAVEFYFQIDGRPMLQFICKQILKITKEDVTEQIKLKPDKVIINIPDFYIPYRIEGFNAQPFTIKLRKE
jgi:hypothetical protein